MTEEECRKKIIDHFSEIGADVKNVVLTKTPFFFDEGGVKKIAVIGRYVEPGNNYWDESKYPMAAISFQA